MQLDGSIEFCVLEAENNLGLVFEEEGFLFSFWYKNYWSLLFLTDSFPKATRFYGKKRYFDA